MVLTNRQQQAEKKTTATTEQSNKQQLLSTYSMLQLEHFSLPLPNLFHELMPYNYGSP